MNAFTTMLVVGIVRDGARVPAKASPIMSL